MLHIDPILRKLEIFAHHLPYFIIQKSISEQKKDIVRKTDEIQIKSVV